MKPVALVARAIRNSSKSRDIVLDPFGGSGVANDHRIDASITHAMNKLIAKVRKDTRGREKGRF